MVDTSFGLMEEIPGQLRVRGARLDGLAEQGALQEPGQCDDGERDQDQDVEIRPRMVMPPSDQDPAIPLG